MNATVDVVDLTEVMSGYRRSRHCTLILARASIERCASKTHNPSLKLSNGSIPLVANSCSFATSARRSKCRYWHVTAGSIKPCARSYVLVPKDFRDSVEPEWHRVVSVAVNCITRNSAPAHRHSRRIGTNLSYLQIYETS